MPFYLREADILPQVADLKSVLIVPCRFCPAASLAVREEKPYIELFRPFLRTGAYESFIQALKHRLEREGIRTAVFDNKWPHHMVTCMWTAARRRALGKRASEFEGVVVLGCNAVAKVVRDSLGATDCQVIQGMEVEGLMTLIPRLSLPLNVSIEIQDILPVATREPEDYQVEADRAASVDRAESPQTALRATG